MNENKTSSRFPKHLKILTSQQDMGYFKTYTIEYPLVKDLSQFFKFSYKIHQLIANNNPTVSQSPNGNLTDGYFQRGDADLVLAVIPDQDSVKTNSFPYAFDEVTFMTNKPEQLARSFAAVHTLEWPVWSGIILTLLSMSLLLYFLLGSSYAKILMHVYKSLLGDSFELKMRRISDKLVVMSWFLFVFFVTNSFKSVLLASLSAPRLEGVRDIDDLSAAAKDPDVLCLSSQGTVRRFILTSQEERIKLIGDCIIRSLKDPRIEGNVLTFVRNNDFKKAYITFKTALWNFRHEMHVSDDIFFTVTNGLSYGIDFCCREQLDMMIHRMTAAGLFQIYNTRSSFFIEMGAIRTSTVQDEPLVKPLTLKNLSGVFIILAAGHVLSVVVFFFEIMLYKKTRSRNWYP